MLCIMGGVRVVFIDCYLSSVEKPCTQPISAVSCFQPNDGTERRSRSNSKFKVLFT